MHAGMITNVTYEYIHIISPNIKNMVFFLHAWNNTKWENVESHTQTEGKNYTYSQENAYNMYMSE